MEELHDLNTMLQLMPQPAFRVENGIISHVNQAAATYLLQPGQSFDSMILHGADEYKEFTSGKLYLRISLGSTACDACISKLECGDIVTFQQASDSSQLQALALAAHALKEPLNGLISATAQILPEVAMEGTQQEHTASQINRRLYQMLRIINNMSDASAYTQVSPRLTETVEMGIFLKEILDKTAVLAGKADIALSYCLPNQQIFTLADRERLERAIYNLLSNAMKFADPGTTIQVKLTQKNKRIALSVTNDQKTPSVQGNLFHRYLREPLWEDPRNGLGLGMLMICSTAAIHGGTVLVDTVDHSTRITITLQQKTSAADQVRSPIHHFDYAGELDHCLLELADVLPPCVYHPDQLN